MDTHDVIAIGGSEGSIEVLRLVLNDLPADLPASVFVAVHVGAHDGSGLAAILDQSGPLPVSLAADGEAFGRGRVYVAVADRHLLLGEGVTLLGRGPRENMARPAIDPLFRSAALHYGPRVLGLVLSGHLNDGTSGLTAIQRCGGLTAVQNPADAAADEMPLHALRASDVDFRAPASGLGDLLGRLAREPAGEAVPAPRDIALEVEFALGRPSDSRALRALASPCTLSCPECGGVLSEMVDKPPLRFRCQIGHAYTAEWLDEEQGRQTTDALVVALRTLESRAALVERMAADARTAGRMKSAGGFEERARDYRRDAEKIQVALLKSGF